MVFHQELEQFVNEVCLKRFNLMPSEYGLELYEPQGDLTQGLSGDPLFFIRDRKGLLLFVVKAYVGERETLENFSALMEGDALLSGLHLQSFSFPRLIAAVRLVKENMRACLIAMEAAQGQTLNALIKSHALSDALKAAALLGKALAELNSASAKQATHPSPFYVERNVRWLFEGLKDIASFPARFPLDLKVAIAPIFEILGEIQKAPSTLSFIHGDAHPGNVFYEEESGRLILTDFDRLTYSADKQKAPSGPAAFEFVFSRFSLKFSAVAHRLLPEETDTLDKAFVSAYKEGMQGLFPTQTALDYYTLLFWMRKIHLIAAAEPNLMPLMQEQVELQRIMALEELTKLLFHDSRFK